MKTKKNILLVLAGLFGATNPSVAINLVLPSNGGLLETYTSEYGVGWHAADLTNGVINEDGWSSTKNPGPQEFVFSFIDGHSASLTNVEIHGGTAEGKYFSKEVQVWVSVDGDNFTLAGGGSLEKVKNSLLSVGLGGVTAKKIKLKVNQGHRKDYWELSEFVVNGDILYPPTDPIFDWVNRFDASLTDSQKEASADPDNDGLSNEYEYLFGMDPTSPENQRAISISDSSGAPTLTYTYRTDVALEYLVETSNDLFTWGDASVSEYVVSSDNGDGTSTITVISDTSFEIESKQFFRIEASEVGI